MIKKDNARNFLIALAILLVILGYIFARSFAQDQVLFSNDGPLGAISTASASMATAWRGVWQDLNWIGIEAPAALPNTAAFSWFLLGNNAVNFSKFHVPLAQLGLGLSLWILLRRFRFHPGVCALGAIAAALDANIFSHACWGLPSRAWTLASVFLALAALVSGTRSHPLLKALLAGWAVANGIMEGFDVGAIFSLYVAAFAIFVPFAMTGEVSGRIATLSALRVSVVAIFSALCAAAALYTLIGTQVMGVADMKQDAATKQQRWDAATQWSLPKAETARVLVPGLFGYRMDTPEGGNYWGAVGQTPGVPQTRHSGAGEYAGALVVILAAFAVANAFRKNNNPYTPFERRCILFFGCAAVISLLFAWGRHAPFYQIVYALPYFSTIRNPIKFMHPFHMAVLILFGFGLEATIRLYVSKPSKVKGGLIPAIKEFWKKAPVFEKRWSYGTLGFVGLMLVASLIYTSSSREMKDFLQKAGFSLEAANQILSFSQGELFLAVLFTAISVVLVILALTGWFAGARLKMLLIAFGALLTIDMVRANAPWVQYYDYKKAYATNPVVEFLRKDAMEHRATARLAPFFPTYLVDQQSQMGQLFAGVAYNWLQTLFQYYNIQNLEPVQMPRTPELDRSYFMAFAPQSTNLQPAFRLWQLSNTRYLLGERHWIEGLFQAFDSGKQRFKTVLAFNPAMKPGITQVTSSDDLDWVQTDNGRFAIVEFTGALPRYFLSPAWTSIADDQAALTQLTLPEFDPTKTVILSGNPELTPATGTNFQGSASLTSYAPKSIELSASNSAPAILVYNDKYSPYWKVTVNDKPVTLLRANYIMRGIPLPAGTHKIRMWYQPPLTGLYISVVAILGAIGVLGLIFVRGTKQSNSPA